MGDLSSIPGLGRSPGEGKGYPFQYSGLENSMDYSHKELDTTEQLSLSFTFPTFSGKVFFFFFFLRKSWKLICFHRHHTVYTAWGVSDFLWKTDPAIIDQTSSAERGAMERGHQQGLRGVESDLCENSLVCGWVCVLFYNVCATELKVKPNSAAT